MKTFTANKPSVYRLIFPDKQTLISNIIVAIILIGIIFITANGKKGINYDAVFFFLLFWLVSRAIRLKTTAISFDPTHSIIVINYLRFFLFKSVETFAYSDIKIVSKISKGSLFESAEFRTIYFLNKVKLVATIYSGFGFKEETLLEITEQARQDGISVL